jgi:hypothetical protein
MEKASTTCDACGRRYEFTSHKDRCPVCCPVDEPDDDDYDYNQESGENSKLDDPGASG